jgi:predicted ArsR family transcriptional regulator
VSHDAPDTRAVLDSVGVLGEESRWELFSFVRRARRAVTREEAAQTVGISRKLAAFHLDKLVAAGLLRARYESTGDAPQFGRRPNVYEPVDRDLAVSIPARRYELLAVLLLQALLHDAPGETGPDAATRAARERGLALGAAAQRADPAPAEGAEALAACGALLEPHGYEPVLADDEVRLRNCPFHPLADNAPALVCGMNHAFLGGYLEGLGMAGVEARLRPTAGECCVRLSARK